MYKKLFTSALSLSTLLILGGCGEDTKKTNELYNPHQKIPHTLYPQKTSGTKTKSIKNTQNKILKPTPDKIDKSTLKTTITNNHTSISNKKTSLQKKVKIKKEIFLHPLVLDKARKNISKQTHKLDTAPKHINKIPTQKQNNLSLLVEKIPTPVKPVKVISHEQIAKILSSIQVVKVNASKEILKSIKVIKAIKPITQHDLPKPPSLTVDIAKAQAIAKIAKSVAFVQSAKAVAKANIAKAVADVKLAQLQDQNHSLTQKDVQKAQFKSAQDVAKAVATTEIAKAKAAATISKSVAKVEAKKAGKFIQTK